MQLRARMWTAVALALAPAPANAATNFATTPAPALAPAAPFATAEEEQGLSCLRTHRAPAVHPEGAVTSPAAWQPAAPAGGAMGGCLAGL